MSCLDYRMSLESSSGKPTWDIWQASEIIEIFFNSMGLFVGSSSPIFSIDCFAYGINNVYPLVVHPQR